MTVIRKGRKVDITRNYLETLVGSLDAALKSNRVRVTSASADFQICWGITRSSTERLLYYKRMLKKFLD